MIRSRNEHYIDEWEGVITVRSIYGGDCTGPISQTEAEQWIAEQRAAFDRGAIEHNRAQCRARTCGCRRGYCMFDGER